MRSQSGEGARGISTTSPRVTVALLAFAVALVADLGAKQLILGVVMAPPRVIEVTPFLNLTLGFNPGISFGLLSGAFADRPMLLAGITALIAAGLLVWAMRSERLLETCGLGLVAGGVERQLLTIPGVTAVHDVHVSIAASGIDAMSAHLVVVDMAEAKRILTEARRILANEFDADHVTIQVENEALRAEEKPQKA